MLTLVITATLTVTLALALAVDPTCTSSLSLTYPRPDSEPVARRCLVHAAVPAVAVSVSALCVGESVVVAAVTRQGTVVLVKAQPGQRHTGATRVRDSVRVTVTLRKSVFDKY